MAPPTPWPCLGSVYQSKDGLSAFVEGPLLFNKKHAARGVVAKRRDTVRVLDPGGRHPGNASLVSTMDVSADWHTWHATEAVEVLRPERPWEGADAPLEPSVRSAAYGHVNLIARSSHLRGR